MRPSPIQCILAGYAIAAVFLLVLNLVTDRSAFWAIWPIWALGAVTAGLVAVVRFPGIRFVAVWLVIGILLAGLTVDLLSSVPTSRPATDGELRPLSEGE